MLIPLIEILGNVFVDSFLIAAGAAGLAGLLILGALYLVLKALKDIMRIIFGVPDPTVRREYINHDGQRVIEEIPYQPGVDMLGSIVQQHRQLSPPT